MLKNFINLDDFKTKEILHDKLIENFDYLSANLICLFIRNLDIQLAALEVELEDVIKKYDVNFSIKSTFNTYDNKIEVFSKQNVIIENNFECLNDTIKDRISSSFFTYGLNFIEKSLKNYLHFMSIVTNTEYEKTINFDLYKAYDLYHNLNNQFNFGTQIQDQDVHMYIKECPRFILNFEKVFTTKIHLLLLNEFGNDLHINFKTNRIFKHSNQNMNNHQDKDYIKQHEYYQLSKKIYSQLNIMDTCYLPVINQTIKTFEQDNLFNYGIKPFQNAIEKNILNNLLTTENNNINTYKLKRI